MLQFPAIDPVAAQLGPLAVRWYGLSYLAGIALGWWLLDHRARKSQGRWSTQDVSDLVFYAAVGAVLGGRIGYVLFYNFGAYLEDPLALFAVWQGGMSFHGGVLGFIAAIGVLTRRQQRPFLAVTDFMVPVVPIGLFFGRLANFINQELWGAPASVPWAVLFTHPAAGGVPRHPSQLYEAGLEGLVLFALLNCLWRMAPRRGTISASFLLGYGVFRFAVEFVREPDAHIGYLAGGWLTMGHVLSLPMILGGMGLLAWARIRSPA